MLQHLTPLWRDRLFLLGGGALGVLCGFYLAQGMVIIPGLVLVASLAVIISLTHTTRLQAGVLCFLAIGYVIGNRGFAQFAMIPGLPLLPGEAALALLAGLQIIERATQGPERRQLGVLEVLILLWILVGGVRFLFDFREYKFTALRDFAMVYYAAYFFVAQTVGRNVPQLDRRLETVLRISSVVLIFTHRLWNLFPDFFLGTLQVGGIPLLFYKADLVGIYFAIGALLQYLRFEQKGGWWRFLLMGVMTLEILATQNRAAMLALIAGGTWLIFGGRWRLTALVIVSVLLGIFGTLWVAHITNTPWQKTPLLPLYEKVVSVVDPSGQKHYAGEDTFNKGDNNRFRLVWWSLVLDATVRTNPITGLGFGYDLARDFVRTYYADAGDDFTARSPHSFPVTIFARMGIIGLLPFLGILLLMARRTWIALHTPDHSGLGAWICAWVIFVSSCFGVVLEGPMGAVLFWVLIGVANSQTPSAIESTKAQSAAPAAAPQPSPIA